MWRRITIALDDTVHPDGPDDDLVHRLRNFGEDLYRGFSLSGQADISLDEIDAATTEFHVLVKAKRHLGGVSAFIAKTLKQHNLDDLFTVSRG